MALADVPYALVKACHRKDRQAIEQLLRMISPDIYRIAYSLLRDHDDADEVVQETLIRIFRHIGTLKECEKFASWAMRITVNQVQTWRIRKGRRRASEVSDVIELEEGVVQIAAPGGPNPREEAVRGEIRGQINRAMASLPDRQRTAVTLFEMEGLSIREIADAMRCSEGAVKFNIHEARKKLQQRLSHLARGLLRRGRDGAAGEAEKSALGAGRTKP